MATAYELSAPLKDQVRLLTHRIQELEDSLDSLRAVVGVNRLTEGDDYAVWSIGPTILEFSSSYNASFKLIIPDNVTQLSLARMRLTAVNVVYLADQAEEEGSAHDHTGTGEHTHVITRAITPGGEVADDLEITIDGVSVAGGPFADVTTDIDITTYLRDSKGQVVTGVHDVEIATGFTDPVAVEAYVSFSAVVKPVSSLPST